MNLSKDRAIRFMLNKQALIGPKRFEGVDGVIAFCHMAGCIQYDPVDTCGRNADLTLQSRVKDYQKNMLSDALYLRRELIDYWDKNMAIIPASDWPFFTRQRRAFMQMDMRSQHEITSREQIVIDFLRHNGPCFSGDLQMPEKLDWYWSETSAARAVLESLYYRGQIGIHHKRGTQKCYDLIDKLISAELLNATHLYPDDTAYLKARIKRRIGAVGLMWDRSSDAFLGIDGLKSGGRTLAFKSLLDEGSIVPVDVIGMCETLYMLKDDEKYLELSDDTPRTEFIAPLDPFLWDRKLIHAMFDFDYKWEIYTPKEQRKYGHYVLPILQGDAFTGRIEMICEYKERVLRVKNIWTQSGHKCDMRSLKRHIKHFSAFAHADEVIYEK